MATLVAAALLSDSVAPANPVWVIREDGAGPAKVGMNLSQLNKALHENFQMPSDASEQGCFYVEPAGHPQIGFMIQAGKLVRVDVSQRGIATVAGVQVGDSEARALKVYGKKLKVEPHFYDPEEGHYLTIESSDGKFGIRFETYQGKITMYYAGRSDAIQFVEGCQ